MDDKWFKPGPDVNAFTLRKLDTLEKIARVWNNNGLNSLPHQRMQKRIRKMAPELGKLLDYAWTITYGEEARNDYI